MSFWNAMSVDFQYVDVYVIHDDDDDDSDDGDHHNHHALWRYVDAIVRFSIFVKGAGGFVWSLMMVKIMMNSDAFPCEKNCEFT